MEKVSEAADTAAGVEGNGPEEEKEVAGRTPAEDSKGAPNDDDTSPDGRFVRYSGESEKLLGEGAYKKVWLACDTLEGREVAWNLINIRNLPKREKHRIVDEIRLLKSLGKNEHIIEFVSTWTKRETGEVIFVTEIMPSGSLKDFINRVRVIKYKVIKKWCSNILHGLIFLHHHQPPIIHRDLKCDNLFYDGSHRRGGKIVIGDMGLSTYMLGPKPGSVLGTPQFMAPELYDDKGYDERIDIYSFGMCVLEMVSKKPPYDGLNVAQIYKRVTAGEKPPLLHKVKNAVCREFISICLGPPNERPTATELVENDFLVTQKIQDDTSTSSSPRRMVVPDDEVAELIDDEDVYTGIAQSAAVESAPNATEEHEKEHEIPTGETMQSRVDEAAVEDDGDSDDDAGENQKIVWNDSEHRRARDTDAQRDAQRNGPRDGPRDPSIVINTGEEDSSIKTVEIEVPEAAIQLEFPMDLRTDTVESIAEEMLQAFGQMKLEVDFTKESIVALVQESLDRQGTRTELSSDVGHKKSLSH